MRPRGVILLAGLGLVAWSPGCAGTADTGGGAVLPIWQRLDQPSLVACGGCHLEVYTEWARSLHHGAWSNDNVWTATKGFTEKACRACHSPMPVLPRGLDRRPRYRDFNQEDGVHCLSCHGLEDGVAAARTVEGAPCRPRYEPRLLQVEICYPCHEPTHQAFAEYRKSDAAATGVRCVDCHMQPSTDRRGRSHGPHGGFDREFVQRALRWDCAVEDGAVRISLSNRSGHKFPGEIPSRSFVVRVDFEGQEPIHELLRKPHKGERREDNRLVPDETRVLRYPFPAGAGSVRVRLLFKPLPLMPEEQAFVLGDWSGRR